MKRLSLLFFISAIFFTISCTTYYTRLSEISNNYAPYNGSNLDPLKVEKVKKFRIGEKKYDEFFENSDKAYILGQFSKRVISSYREKTANNDSVSTEKQAVGLLFTSISDPSMNPQKLTRSAKELLVTVKSDFSGAVAYKGLEVTNGLNDSIAKLQTLASEMPGIIKDLKDIANSKGLSVSKGGEADIKTAYRSAKLKELLFEYETLRGERFSGTVFPQRFYDVPASIREEYNVVGKKLLLAKTRTGKTKIIVLVPESMGNEIGAKISSGEKMTLIYTPIGVYQKVYPVVELVENPRQMGDEMTK